MASLADQFLQDAGAGQTVRPAGSLADQFLADASGKPSLSASPSAPPSQWDQFGRQLGLTARHAITGITSLPAMVGDALNAGVNEVFGAHLQPVSAALNDLQIRAGLPQPKNATERIVGDMASGIASVPTLAGIGGGLATSARPTVAAISNLARMAPGMQMLGAAGAGGGSGGARELGLGPAWQIGAGLAGGTAGIVGGSAATTGVRALESRFGKPTAISPDAAAGRASQGVDKVIADLGPQAGQSYASADMDALKSQVAQQIQQNPQISPAAAVRALDFRTLGIPPTLGQITRDPMQYAHELNLRGVRGVGDPIANRINQQNAQLRQTMYGLVGTPSEAYQAGASIKGALKSIDDRMAKGVSDAYAAAESSSGARLDVPLAGVAQDYAQVVHDFGDKVPTGVRNNFNGLGLQSGMQRKTFSINDAEKLLKVINANASHDPATNAALGRLRTAVKNAILSADDQGGVFAQPRQLAAQRFALHDQIPALEAAASDSINADDFVRKYLIGGKTDEVSALAGLLKQHALPSYNEARSQVGSQLAKKGFGQNPAGDSSFNPSGFASQMQSFGPAKLAAFYSPAELEQLNAIGRVGAYIGSVPSSSPVNFSNTGSAVASLAGEGLKKIPYIGGLVQNAENRMFVKRALGGLLSDAISEPTQTRPPSLLDMILMNQATQAPRRN